MKKIKKFFIPIFILLALLIFIESQTKGIHRLLDNILYDNQNHYLPCSKLPSEAHVNEIITAHQDTLDAILAVDPGNVGYEIDTHTCPGMADLVIWYASHQDRIAIQEIIHDTSFYEVPLRLQNR